MNLSEIRLETRKELVLKFMDRQLEAGKWLLGSLLLVNGGAIVGLLSNPSFGAALLAQSGVWFLAGMLSAFIAGFFSWALSDFVFAELRVGLGIRFHKDEQISKMHGSGSGMGICLILTFLFATISLLCFSIGALSAAGAVAAEQGRIGSSTRAERSAKESRASDGETQTYAPSKAR